MKKVFSVLLLCAALLCGCQSGADTNDYSDAFQKTQEIQVTAADAETPSAVLTSQDEITAFVSQLELDHWSPASLPQDVSESGTFALSQTPTVTLGQTEPDQELHLLLTLRTYRDAPFLTLTLAGISTSFEVPEEVSSYLNSFFA